MIVSSYLYGFVLLHFLVSMYDPFHCMLQKVVELFNLPVHPWIPRTALEVFK